MELRVTTDIETSASAVTSYADQARAALRVMDPTETDLWRATYEAGLKEAYRLKDFEGLTSIALFAAVCMHVQRMFREAIEQIDFAITMARGNPDASAYMLSARSVYEIFHCDEPRAQTS